MSGGRHFMKMLRAQWQKGNHLCVGLDSEVHMIPKRFHEKHDGDVCSMIVDFNVETIWQTYDLACAFAINDVFYKAHGEAGMRALKMTMDRIHLIAPKVPVLINICAGDIGHSNKALVDYVFGYLDADGITLNSYFGQEASQLLLDRSEKGIVVLCRTSNFGAGEFQDMPLSELEGVPFWRTVAWRVSQYWNSNSNCALLIGATFPGQLREIRSLQCNLPIFVTGVGPQSKSGKIEEDDIKDIVIGGKDKEGSGIVICSSRGIIFSQNPKEEAFRLHNLINKYLR